MKKAAGLFIVCYTDVFIVVTQRSSYPRMRQKKLKYSLCRFAEILHAKQSHQSGWNRVIGKILALTKDTLIPRRVMCLVGSFSIGYLSTGPVHRLVFAIHTGF